MSASLTAPAFLAREIATAARRPGVARTLLLHVDGTLAPIAATPEAARVPARTLEALTHLFDLGWLVGIVSGRPAAEVKAMVPVCGVRLFGSHGAEDHANDDRSTRPSHEAQGVLSRLAADATRLAEKKPGARIEVKPTGHRAANLKELIDLVRAVPLEVIHHHLHRTPLSHRFGVWDFPNDFAQWATRSLGDLALAEKLAALDPFVHASLEAARDPILEILDEHLDARPIVPWARPGFEFHFASGYFLALPGEREAWTLAELRDAIAEVPLSSLYYHFHEVRLRVAGDESDHFSRWIEGQLGPNPIVVQLRGIDLFFSLEDLRQRILSIIDQHRDGGAA